MRTGINKILFLIMGCACLAASCNKQTDPTDNPGTDVPSSERASLKLTPFFELNQGETELNSHAGRISYSRLTPMYPTAIELGGNCGMTYPYYPRCRKMANGAYIIFWQTSGDPDTSNGVDTHYSISGDLKNWSYKGTFCGSKAITNALGKADKRRYTNANAIVLKNGELLGAASFWCSSTYNNQSCLKDQGIVIKRSLDNGETWSEETEIYHGPCWEPHLMQISDDEIHIYFSESRPWISSSHSGTDVLVSKDGGKTWSPVLDATPYRVMRHKWYSDYDKRYFYTDQMPVGIVVNGMKQMAFAMECVNSRTASSGGGTSQGYDVSIDYSPVSGEWEYLQGDEESSTDPEFYTKAVVAGTAPYLVQFRSGESVLAYSKEKSPYNYAYKTGDETARNFGEEKIALSFSSRWGGLEIDSDHTILFYAQNRSNGTENATVSLVRFALNHDIYATMKSGVKVDGDNSEWKKGDDALFTGSKCIVQSTVRIAYDDENVYALFEVSDNDLNASDYSCLYLSASDGQYRLNGKSIRIKFGPTGLKNVSTYAGGWKESELGVKAKVMYDGTIGQSDDSDNGYLAEIMIPKSSVNLSSDELMINMSTFDAGENVEESICSSSSVTTEEWLKVYFTK